MNTTKKIEFRKVLATAFAITEAALLGVGCVAVPMGTRTFETEYQTGIRATFDRPTKIYEIEPIVSEGDQFQRTTTIGLAGKITTEQPRIQKIEKISVEKKKRISFGLMPGMAEDLWSPQGSLQPMWGWKYYGNGNYRTIDKRAYIISVIPMTVYATLIAPFADSYECDSHHWADRGTSISEANYLAKFSPDDRTRIGAWIWSDNDTHKQHPYKSLFSHTALFGFHKYCCYTLKGPFEEDRPIEPEIKTEERTVPGPYSVTLTLPDLGFSQTVDVSVGETVARFDLEEMANGQKFVNGIVQFSPPLGGLSQIVNADDRACLEEAQRHDYPVTIALPTPKLESIVDE